MDKKYQKVTVILILSIILMLTFNPASSKNTNLSDDQIDQEQTESSGKDYIYNGYWKAQSFKPNTEILSRIQLYINKIGSITTNFEIIIKKSLTGEELTSCSIPSDEIPTISEWVNFDFPDITTSINDTYYIICKTNSGDQYNSYNWYEQSGDLYKRGTKYYSEDSGTTWHQNPDFDFCFKTYGKKAELDIEYITAGFGWNIFYGIKNIGNLETKNIYVYITFSGGLILTKKTYIDNINQTIKPGEILENTISPVIGLGPTTVTITVSSYNTQPVSTTKEAFLLLFYIYISP